MFVAQDYFEVYNKGRQGSKRLTKEERNKSKEVRKMRKQKGFGFTEVN